MTDTIKQKLTDAYINNLLNDYKHLAYILTDGGDDLGTDEYYKQLDDALDKARQTFPDLQKKGEQNHD